MHSISHSVVPTFCTRSIKVKMHISYTALNVETISIVVCCSEHSLSLIILLAGTGFFHWSVKKVAVEPISCQSYCSFQNSRNKMPECVLLNLIFWYLIISPYKWWLNQTESGPWTTCAYVRCGQSERETRMEKKKTSSLSPQGKHFHFDHVISQENKSRHTVRAIRSAVSCLPGPDLELLVWSETSLWLTGKG